MKLAKVFDMASVLLPTSIQVDPAAIIRTGTAAVPIAAGQTLYLDLTTNRLRLADADASSGTAECVGIALNSATAGQTVTYVTEGTITGLTGVKQGQWYFVSNTPGSVCEATLPGDLTEDVSFVTFVGIGLSTTSMRVNVFPSGVLLNLT